jgi:hypothetical protein
MRHLAEGVDQVAVDGVGLGSGRYTLQTNRAPWIGSVDE